VQKCVTQATGPLLLHEFELQRSLPGTSSGFECGLERTGDQDSPLKPSAGNLIQRPVEDGPQADREQFLREPAGDGLKPGAEPAAGNHRCVQHWQGTGGGRT
jgi:hypothetical protein